MAIGAGLALLPIVNDPVYDWAAVGLKVTLRLQVLPGATATLQVPSVAENGAPVVTEVMASKLAPVFVTLTFLVTEVLIRTPPPPKLVFAMVAAVVAGMPLPLNATTEGGTTGLLP